MKTDYWFCAHKETTHPDSHGYAICLACGGAIAVRLTEYILKRSWEAARKNQS